MRASHAAELVLLAALWGGSFLLMRLGAHDFGPPALVFVRVAGAAVLLMPLLALRGQLPALRQHWRPIAVVGALNSALPFLLFVVAAWVLTAGLMSVFNATAPLWGTLFAWWLLGDKPSGSRLLGLAIGVAGVIGLSWGKADLKAGDQLISPAMGIAACVAATICYGLSATYSRQYLAGIPPLAVAAGSQLTAALLLVLPAWWWWPASNPGATAWGAALVLAVACTGVAYVLYFRLIAQVGPSKALAVTFLIPAFAIFWGWAVLGERPTLPTGLGCAVILLGTALATGALSATRPGHQTRSATKT